jgi:hypothetical protein
MLVCAPFSGVVEDQANAKLVQAQLAEEDRQRAQDKEEQRAVRKDLDMSEDSMHNRRARDKRKSIFLSMSIDSRMALPDELIITKQQVVLPSANPARGNQSLLRRELRAGDNLRGIDLNELLSDGDDDDASVGGGSSLDSSASFARARDGQPQLHGGSAGGDDVSSLNLSEREILARIDQLHANGDASSSGASGSTELSGYRVTEVLLMPKGSLNLAYRGLGSLSDDLFQLPMLTSLDIKANSVTVIPPEISRLVSLVSLDLSRYVMPRVVCVVSYVVLSFNTGLARFCAEQKSSDGVAGRAEQAPGAHSAQGSPQPPQSSAQMVCVIHYLPHPLLQPQCCKCWPTHNCECDGQDWGDDPPGDARPRAQPDTIAPRRNRYLYLYIYICLET